MAARGSVTKQKIIQKILEVFPDSFTYNDGKEVRINDIEDGVPIQIKIGLTAAKIPVENENGTSSLKAETASPNSVEMKEKVPQEPTEEEKERLTMLLNKLGL